jgi:hypothetical protein
LRPPPKSPPLWRFFAASAALVAIVGTIVFAHRSAPPDLRISDKVAGTPTPTVERPDADASARAKTAFVGQGSWVMSSLPACFDEQRLVRGSLADVRAELPPAADRLPPATVIRRGACTLVVGAHDLVIARGPDRLRVPPEAALYRRGERLTLVARTGNRVEIRVY